MRFAPRANTRRSRPFRVGIWLDYGIPIGRDEGIGIFVYDLAKGLLALDEAVQVVLLARAGDEGVVTALCGGPHTRLEVHPKPDGKPPIPVRLGNALRKWVGWSDSLRAHADAFHQYYTHSRARLLGVLKRSLGAVWYKVRGHQPLAAGLAGVAGPVLFTLAWSVHTLECCARALSQILAFPLSVTDRLLRRLSAHPRLAALPKPEPLPAPEVARRAAADVWIIPQALLNHPLTFPSVLFIHDHVASHFPDEFERWYPGYLERAMRLMPLRAVEATLCACMSAFIRDTDLLGILGLSPAKVRMVRSAPPGDLLELKEPPKSAAPAFLKRPYLFWPTAFRPYKNHAGLIKAVHILRDRYGEDGWDLVFTGERPGCFPDEIQKLVQECALQDRVHVLGRIPRETLAALFKYAFAAIIPSLYEQGSFQIYEALCWRTPVAVARIPSLAEQCAEMGDAMLYFDPRDPEAIAQTILHIRQNRENIIERQASAGKGLWTRTWVDVAREWLPIFKEAAEIAGQPKHVQDRRLLKPWPNRPARLPAPAVRPEIYLFLQLNYIGGVWEATKDLLRALVQINQERNQLILTLGLHEEQQDTEALDELGPELPIERFQLEHITRAEAGRLLGSSPAYLARHPREMLLFMNGSQESALRADAWFALSDRFWSPLLPARPYGVFVYDMIQRHAPEAFDPAFFKWVEHGIAPTVKDADLILTTSAATRGDVIAEYGLNPARVRTVPWACEPQRRFSGLNAQHVELPRELFILQIANASPHKGAAVLLRAYARLKQQLGDNTPLLVLAGLRTDLFSPRYRGDFDHSMFQRIRQLVSDLQLEDGKDVAFLGFVNDGQLVDLYQRAGVVVNSAKYDNGSFCLIEARYFGRPVISSRYPAVEALCERFAIPARFFPVENDEALADLLVEAMVDRPTTGMELQQIRQRLAGPGLGLRHYAVQVYDILVELARHGRRARLSHLATLGAASNLSAPAPRQSLATSGRARRVEVNACPQ